MFETRELLEQPLSVDELAMRYRALSEDPCFAHVPGKVEIDVWGRLLMSPPSVYHGRVQANVAHKLKAILGGEVITEAPIATPAGLFLCDVAWASATFMAVHGSEFSLTRAPQICVEVVAATNSVRELAEKRDGYLAAGAEEVWIVYPQSKRCEFYGQAGLLTRSAYAVDLGDIF